MKIENPAMLQLAPRYKLFNCPIECQCRLMYSQYMYLYMYMYMFLYRLPSATRVPLTTTFQFQLILPANKTKRPTAIGFDLFN